MSTTFTTTQLAQALAITEADTMDLLREFGFAPTDGMLSFAKTEEFLQLVQDSPSLLAKRGKANLERVADRYTLVFDTCALLHDRFPDLFERLQPLLRSSGKRIVIPSKVEEELKLLFLRKSDLRGKVSTVLNLLDSGEREGLVEVVSSGSSFGDQQILTLVMELRTKEEPLVVTFDRALSEDLLRMNAVGSVAGRNVAVSRISLYGYLSRYNPKVQVQCCA